MNIQEIIKNPPRLHQESSETLASWKLSDEILYFIDQQVNESSKTLETGAGISTIIFAMKSSQHTCIIPDQQQVNRIKEYCHKNQISTDKIDFKIDVSQNVLPHLDIHNLDCILIRYS